MISRRENKEIHNRNKGKKMKKKRTNKKKFMTYEEKLSKEEGGDKTKIQMRKNQRSETKKVQKQK